VIFLAEIENCIIFVLYELCGQFNFSIIDSFRLLIKTAISSELSAVGAYDRTFL